ncbi:MAG: hypothetical protein LBS96_07035, partial [Oscillospiraceae bacterium]|nr:hypothetical protein [Oscillospiraceae bacterium]
ESQVFVDFPTDNDDGRTISFGEADGSSTQTTTLNESATTKAGVHFIEPLIEQKVRQELGKTQEAIITDADLLSITSFYFYGSSVQNLADLSGMLNLEILSWDHGTIDTLQPIKDLKKLKRLTIESTTIKSASGLEAMLQLEYLCLNQSNLADFDGFIGQTALKELDITYTNITDVSWLENMQNLETFTAWYLVTWPEVIDFSPLRFCKNLKEIGLRETSITDISPLFELDGLEHVNLYEASVFYEPDGEAQYQELKRRLPNCEISWGRRSD